MTPSELLDNAIRAYVIREAKRIMSNPETDVTTAVTTFQSFLSDLAALLPKLQAALASATNVDAATVTALDNVVAQVQPLQAQFDALGTPAVPPVVGPAVPPVVGPAVGH